MTPKFGKQLLAVMSLLLAAEAIVTPALAESAPERVSITPALAEGAVLMQIDRTNVDQQVSLQRSGTGGFGSRVYALKASEGEAGKIFLARTLKPGRYRIASIWQQKSWGLLFARETVEFEVKPGRIVYLGALNNTELLTELQREAYAAGKTVGGPGWGFSSETHGLLPTFTARDDAGLAEAGRYAGHAMNAREGMVEIAPLFSLTLK